MNREKTITDELILQTLKQYWGYGSFREQQIEIIRSVLSGHDTLALLPTGGGKSITYQIPAMLSEGVCIVVTPLISLMKDQVDALRRRHISAVALHSGMTMRQIDTQLDNCVYGDVKFLYVSPERVATDLFKMRLRRMTVALVAIDEAHCISQWGYDFRPSYVKLSVIREVHPDVPILALTASATELVVKDIMQNLSFGDFSHVFRGSFTRSNLSYVVRHTDNKEAQLMRTINNVNGSGIVYVRTRDQAEKIAEYLYTQGVSSTFYHGGLEAVERAIRQDEWISGKVRVIVATNAFGMGIDKQDVRFVVHYTMCDSLESYYQEAGRAGRDGNRSYALLLVDSRDAESVKKRFKAEFPPLEQVKDVYEQVCSYLGIGIGEGESASMIFNIYDFCSKQKLFALNVINSLKLLQLNGYLTLIDAMENPARVMFTVSRDDLYKVRVQREDIDHFIRVLLRLYDGVFTDFRPIDEHQIAAAGGYTLRMVKEYLSRLWRMRLIRYIPSNNDPMIYFNCERLPRADLYISPQTYKRRMELAEERFGMMNAYAQNQSECRNTLLEHYFFPSVEHTPCGVCDICIESRRTAAAPQPRLAERVMNVIEQQEGVDIAVLAREMPCNEGELTRTIQQLAESGKICISDCGFLTIKK